MSYSLDPEPAKRDTECMHCGKIIRPGEVRATIRHNSNIGISTRYCASICKDCLFGVVGMLDNLEESMHGTSVKNSREEQFEL